MKTPIILTFLGLFGYSFDLTDAIQANEEIATEINGHQMQTISLDIVTSESSDRNQCQDKQSGCPGWKWACTNNQWKTWMADQCPKTCGLCPDVQCQDSNQFASNCPFWKWACTVPQHISFMQTNCKKSCGWCSGSGGQTCAKVPSWMKNGNRIVNGQFAPSPIPWQVKVRANFNSIGKSFMCGGTILDEETILSAAHCFYHHESGTTAFPMDSGDLILAGIRREGSSGQQRILMKNVIIHPQYNPVNEDTDIAIVKLKSPLSFNNNVKNACLPGSSFAPQSNNAVVSGWGWTIPENPNSASIWLKYTMVPFITNAKCVRPHTNYPSNAITSNMVCAGFLNGEIDSCKGDSGGPLVVPKSLSDDTAIVYGVVSWGWGCAVAKQPGVYVRVTNYLPWIKANMK